MANAITQDNRETFPVANAGQVDFAVSFAFQQEEDLEFSKQVNGVYTPLTLNVDYTVTGGDSAAGTIHLTTPAEADQKYRIKGLAELDINIQVTGQRRDPSIINKLFERCLIWATEQGREVARVLGPFKELLEQALPAAQAASDQANAAVEAVNIIRDEAIAAKDQALVAKGQAEDARDIAQEAVPPFPISQVTGLQAALGEKAASAHTHEMDQVTGLTDALGGKADKSGVKILAIHVFEQASRVAVSPANERKLFGGDFNKLSDTSKIIATCTVFGAAFSGGICGVGMVLDDTWDFGCGYQYDGAWNASQTTIVIGTSEFGVVPAGAKRIDFGWKTNNGVQDRPFIYLCPNQSDDARNPQTVSRIVVYEIEV